MRKIGLKLWSINKNYFNEAKRLFEEGFYDYIELYAVPDTLEHIAFWKTLNIPFIIHAPHYGSGLNFSVPEKADENRRLAEQAIRYADELEAEYIIFHPGISGCIEETARQMSRIAEPRILLENKPYRGFGDLICVGSRPEEIASVMKQCNIGCCLDIGHAICAANSHGVDHVAFLKQFVALGPSMYHLSDGDVNGQLDRHDHLGEGSYDLETLIKLIDFNKPITLETDKNSKHDLDDFRKDVGDIRKWT